jgi:hypothetical protein
VCVGGRGEGGGMRYGQQGNRSKAAGCKSGAVLGSEGWCALSCTAMDCFGSGRHVSH